MLEKFNQLAEQAATSASRRSFLGRVGRGAMAAVAGLSGLLAFNAHAQAGRQPRICPAGSFTGCVGYQEFTPCTIDGV